MASKKRYEVINEASRQAKFELSRRIALREKFERGGKTVTRSVLYSDVNSRRSILIEVDTVKVLQKYSENYLLRSNISEAANKLILMGWEYLRREFQISKLRNDLILHRNEKELFAKYFAKNEKELFKVFDSLLKLNPDVLDTIVNHYKKEDK
jgi:hypothetical protein